MERAVLQELLKELRSRREVAVDALSVGGAKDWVHYREVVGRIEEVDRLMEIVKEIEKRLFQEDGD
jgi:hypothetical protein